MAEKAVTLAKREEKFEAALEAYIVWSHVLRIRGDHQDAANTAQDGVNLARGMGDSYGESRLLNMQGLIALDQRDFDAAQEYFYQSLAVAQDIGDRHCETRPLNNLGNLLGFQGDYQAAESFYQRSLAKTRETGNRHLEGMALMNLGWIASVQGDYHSAIEAYLQCQDIAHEINDRYQEAFAFMNLCSSKLALGDHGLALEYAQEGIRLFREIDDKSDEAWTLTFQGHAYFELGEYERSIEAYRNALKIRQELNQLNLSTEPLAGMARISLISNDLSEASGFVQQILSYLDQGGSLDGTEHPIRVWQTCYQVLLRAEDPRTESVLIEGYQALQARADQIKDQKQRRKYLEDIPYHADIVKAWRAHFEEQSD